LQKILEIVTVFCSHPKRDVTVAETRLLRHRTRKSVKRFDLYRCARNQKVMGCKKIDTDHDNFMHMYNCPPLRIEIYQNTKVCVWVTSLT